MYQLVPVAPRVERMRKLYRSTTPHICIERYRIVTEFYQEHEELTGILKRARCFHAVCEKIPVRIGEEEVIVGAQSGRYKAAALYPENTNFYYYALDTETGLHKFFTNAYEFNNFVARQNY